jgi:hypothetical protein
MGVRQKLDPGSGRTIIQENGLSYVFVMAAPRAGVQETNTGVFFDSEGNRIFCKGGIARDLPVTDKVVPFPKTAMVVVDDIFEQAGLNPKEPEQDVVGIWAPVV